MQQTINTRAPAFTSMCSRQSRNLRRASDHQQTIGVTYASEIGVVNIGCDHDDLPTPKALTEWHIPDFSVDPEAAFTALENRVTDLATQ